MTKVLPLITIMSVQMSSFAQIQQRSYLIISFEDIFKISQHGNKSYYWIIETDSIKSNNFQPSYLFLNFSKDNLEDCCKGIDVDPFLVFPDSNYEVDSLHTYDLENLKKIIAKNKKQILVIKKDWVSGQKEKIKIYATTVVGKFCFSNFHEVGQHRQGYKGKVYMPLSSFQYRSDFWKTPQSKFILNSDLSKMRFDVITY